MPELTLESLAARVEVLERAKETPPMRGGHVFIVTPATVDRATAVAILRDDTEYDFDANADMNEVELRSVGGEVS